MKMAVALVLDLLAHIRRVERGAPKLFTLPQAQIVRKNVADYINGISCPTQATLSTMPYILRGCNLPYPISGLSVITDNNIGVEVGGEILLLHWCKNSARKEWGRRFRRIKGSHTVEYEYNDGTLLRFEFIPKTFEAISYLRTIGFRIYTGFRRIEHLADVDESRLDKRLFPYQVEGVRMLQTGYRLLADEQGLGKTCTTLQFLMLNKAVYKKILVCCPASLKLNWRKEILMWTDAKPGDIQVLSGSTPYECNRMYTIINYDILPYWAEYLASRKFDFVCADECHYIQNSTAKRTKAFMQVVRRAKDALFISGTPFTSRPMQMYNALHCIAPSVFRDQQEFGMRFCDPKREGMRWSFKGASNMDVLHDIIKDGICIRRLKEDVLSELPDKMRIVVPVVTDTADLRKDPDAYNRIREMEKHIAEAKNYLSTLEWQKQIAYLRKRREIGGWVEDFLESGKKLVVFATHTMTLDDLQKRFGSLAVRIDGDTSMRERDRAVTAFQNDPKVKLLLGNIKAAGVGLTLTAASDVLITEFPWTCAEVLQSEDRIHRIGQKNAAKIWFMCCPNTIDDRLMEIVNRKAATHRRIFDGVVEEDNMLEILRKEGGVKYEAIFADDKGD